MNTELLPLEFIGTGEVACFHFVQIASSAPAYIYEVTRAVGAKSQYEVIRRIYAAKCIDFGAKLYSQTEFKEIYPKANQFGKTAWAFVTKEEALSKFNQMSATC